MVNSECPAPEQLFPCKCVSDSIECKGNETKIIPLKSLSSTHFNTLSIQQTSATTIDDISLGNATFESIIIANNTLLETISKNVLNKTLAKGIIVNNNTKLTSDSILAFVKTLEVTEKLDIINTNYLVEIPINAFQTISKKSKLTSINLSDNKISKLGSNAFNNLPNLTNLVLKNNLITKLDDNSLTIANTENQKITVDLSNNKLTEKSFTKSTFIREDNISIELILDNNTITTLPEDSFKNFLANNKNQLSLNNNKFNCDCNMKWILDKSQDLKKTLHNIICQNKNNKSLFDLKASDFNCPTKPPTTTKPTPIPYTECPDKKLIDPCVCNSHNFQCEGKDLKQLPFNKLEKSRFESLRIFNTSLVSIDDNSLGNATFSVVYIENNTLLETISDKVFATEPLQLFMINYGNTKLKPNSLFAMFRSLEMTEEIEFNFEDLTEIPENAFKPNNGSDTKLFIINLKENNISKIGSNAFNGLSNLVDIELENNSLTTIDDWLNFPPNPNKIRNVILANNKLNDKSFNTSTFKSEENIFINLNLANNMITKFPENIFAKYFTNGRNIIDLDKNKMECDCSMKWILDNSSKLSKLIQNFDCANIKSENKNIFSLTTTLLGCAEEKTTTPKTK